jgi:hypothetical protein
LLSLTSAHASAVLPPSAPVVGDAASVIEHCGTPTSDKTAYEPGAHHAQSVLVYDYPAATLRFQPARETWSFTAGTQDGQLDSLPRLEDTFPCLREGLSHPYGATVNHTASQPISATSGAPQESDLSFFRVRSLVVFTLLGMATTLLVLWPPPRYDSGSPMQSVRHHR